MDQRGGEFGPRKTLCHKAKECRRFGKRAAFGYQCGNAPFGVYREVFGAPLALRAKIDQNRLVRRASLFQRDVRRKRTRTGGVKKSEHVVRPSIDHAPRSARRPFGRHSAGRGRAVSPCDAIRGQVTYNSRLAAESRSPYLARSATNRNIGTSKAVGEDHDRRRRLVPRLAR